MTTDHDAKKRSASILIFVVIANVWSGLVIAGLTKDGFQQHGNGCIDFKDVGDANTAKIVHVFP